MVFSPVFRNGSRPTCTLAHSNAYAETPGLRRLTVIYDLILCHVICTTNVEISSPYILFDLLRGLWHPGSMFNKGRANGTLASRRLARSICGMALFGNRSVFEHPSGKMESTTA